MLDAFGKHLIVDFKEGVNLDNCKIIQQFIHELISILNITITCINTENHEIIKVLDI